MDENIPHFHITRTMLRMFVICEGEGITTCNRSTLDVLQCDCVCPSLRVGRKGEAGFFSIGTRSEACHSWEERGRKEQVG